MTSLAYYRLPYADTYTKIQSERKPLMLESIESIEGQSGFAVVPFRQLADSRIVLIQPDVISKHAIPAAAAEAKAGNACPSIPSEAYEQAFSAFHDAVSNGRFHKLVLARKAEKQLTEICTSNLSDSDSPYQSLFERACQMYPRLMIILFSTPATGTWIIASPEILIEGKDDSYHTVALAGTMAYSEGYLDWSEKNKREQNIVERYIKGILDRHCKDILVDGPVTTRAGNLVHLRTDFRFKLAEGSNVMDVVSSLHPTPAVCGLPKQEAVDFIAQNERLDRRYYSGFAGPVAIDGETHLYVSLRCAELFLPPITQHPSPITHHPTPNTQHPTPQAILYAGGGIMPESECSAEWHETEQKMKTIGNVL